MQREQEQFMNFILTSIENEHREDAIALLEESFTRQAQGTLTEGYLDDFNANMLGFVKQEKYDEIKNILETFKQNIKR